MSTRDNIRNRLVALAATEPSKQAFADKCGVSRQAVNSWLTGVAAPDIERLAFIAKSYHLPISAFLDDEEANSANGSDNVQDLILLDYFHRADQEGQQTILRVAQAVASSSSR